MWAKKYFSFPEISNKTTQQLLHFSNNLLINSDTIITKIAVKDVTGLSLSPSVSVNRDFGERMETARSTKKLGYGMVDRGTALGHPSLS